MWREERYRWTNEFGWLLTDDLYCYGHYMSTPLTSNK
jgi:hypothetical protein